MAETNPGYALAAVLKSVRENLSQGLKKSWTITLQAEFGSPEFAIKHAEVVQLYLSIATRIHTLPETTRERSRYLRYLSAWHKAIISPSSWDDRLQPNQFLATEALDLLEAAGEFLGRTYPGMDRVLDGDELLRLESELDSLIDLVAASDIEQSKKDEFYYRVAYIRWLIRNIDLFGDHLIREQAAHLVSDLFANWRSFPKAITGALAGVVGAIVMILGPVEVVTDKAVHIIENVRTILTEIDGSADGDK